MTYVAVTYVARRLAAAQTAALVVQAGGAHPAGVHQTLLPDRGGDQSGRSHRAAGRAGCHRCRNAQILGDLVSRRRGTIPFVAGWRGDVHPSYLPSTVADSSM